MTRCPTSPAVDWRARALAAEAVVAAARCWVRAVDGDGRPDVARRDTYRALESYDAARGGR